MSRRAQPAAHRHLADSVFLLLAIEAGATMAEEPNGDLLSCLTRAAALAAEAALIAGDWPVSSDRPSLGIVDDLLDEVSALRDDGTQSGPSREAHLARFSYIEGLVRPARLHSGLGYQSPMTYEAEREAALTEP